MPKPPVSARAEDILLKPNPAVLGTVRPDGRPHTAAVWYDWVDGRVLLSMDASRLRLNFIRENPQGAITVMDKDNWFITVTINGPITLEDDEGLRGIDRLAQRYISSDYPDRDRPRVTGWMETEGWFLWDAHSNVKDLEESTGQSLG
jgi:PPOX class probable F420-dependent enzyme